MHFEIFFEKKHMEQGNEIFREKLRVFKNPYLEALTKTSPLVTILVYVPVIFFFLYLTFIKNALPIASSLLVFASGAFVWSLLEYLLHRFLFHFDSDSDTGKRIHYVLHGVHHHFPRNKEKLFMPPVPGLTLVFILYLVFGLILREFVFVFLAGLITGYLAYVFLHYFIHTVRPPKMLKFLWTHHFLHHHRFPEKCFGVSSTLWDRIFRTMPPKKEKGAVDGKEEGA
jgi:sterol desaturase/sphingolipid hydroxylase (fatty acid hydroxylase superfamily)